MGHGSAQGHNEEVYAEGSPCKKVRQSGATLTQSTGQLINMQDMSKQKRGNLLPRNTDRLPTINVYNT